MRLEDETPRRWQNSPKFNVSKRWLAFVYSAPTQSETFRSRERLKQQAGFANCRGMARPISR